MEACLSSGILGCADLLAGMTTTTASGTGLPSLSTTETDKLPADAAVVNVERVMSSGDFFMTGGLCKMSDGSLLGCLLGCDDVTMHGCKQGQHKVCFHGAPAGGESRVKKMSSGISEPDTAPDGHRIQTFSTC